MVSFTRINSASTQTYITTSKNPVLKDADRTPGTTLLDHKPSYVAVSQSERYIIKLIRPRKWHERVKMLWLHSRLHKEIAGNRLLARQGFRVPEIMESGSSFPAIIPAPFLGYYIMENLKSSGFREVKELFIQHPELRSQVLERVIDGLRRMRDQHIVFSDFHLTNVMVNDQGELAWIDTGITHYQWYRRYKFAKKFNFSINRLIKYYSNDFFTEQERQQVRQLLIS